MIIMNICLLLITIGNYKSQTAGIAQLGERQTEDLKVACSIHAHRIFTVFFFFFAIYLPHSYVC